MEPNERKAWQTLCTRNKTRCWSNKHSKGFLLTRSAQTAKIPAIKRCVCKFTAALARDLCADDANLHTRPSRKKIAAIMFSAHRMVQLHEILLLSVFREYTQQQCLSRHKL